VSAHTGPIVEEAEIAQLARHFTDASVERGDDDRLASQEPVFLAVPP